MRAMWVVVIPLESHRVWLRICCNSMEKCHCRHQTKLVYLLTSNLPEWDSFWFSNNSKIFQHESLLPTSLWRQLKGPGYPNPCQTGSPIIPRMNSRLQGVFSFPFFHLIIMTWHQLQASKEYLKYLPVYYNLLSGALYSIKLFSPILCLDSQGVTSLWTFWVQVNKQTYPSTPLVPTSLALRSLVLIPPSFKSLSIFSNYFPNILCRDSPLGLSAINV